MRTKLLHEGDKFTRTYVAGKVNRQSARKLGGGVRLWVSGSLVTCDLQSGHVTIEDKRLHRALFPTSHNLTFNNHAANHPLLHYTLHNSRLHLTHVLFSWNRVRVPIYPIPLFHELLSRWRATSHSDQQCQINSGRLLNVSRHVAQANSRTNLA